MESSCSLPATDGGNTCLFLYTGLLKHEDGEKQWEIVQVYATWPFIYVKSSLVIEKSIGVFGPTTSVSSETVQI